MFTYHIHFKESCVYDNYSMDIYFQANGIINLHEMGEKMKKLVARMNDEEDELYDEFSDYVWEEQIDFAFDMVVENEYHDAERIDVFTATVEI